jgi:hypothetical protein
LLTTTDDRTDNPQVEKSQASRFLRLPQEPEMLIDVLFLHRHAACPCADCVSVWLRKVAAMLLLYAQLPSHDRSVGQAQVLR